MQYVILTFSIILFSPIAIGSTNTTTVFSWLDTNDVMHFSDAKPKSVSIETITITDVEEPTELGTPEFKAQTSDDASISTISSKEIQPTEINDNVVASNINESTVPTVITTNKDNKQVELQQ